MRLLNVGITLTLLASACMADSVTLKSGRVINGTYLGGTARTVRVDLGDRIETLDVSDVTRIDFGTAAPSSTANERRPVSRSNADEDNNRPVLRRSEGSENSGILR